MLNTSPVIAVPKDRICIAISQGLSHDIGRLPLQNGHLTMARLSQPYLREKTIFWSASLSLGPTQA